MTTASLNIRPECPCAELCGDIPAARASHLYTDLWNEASGRRCVYLMIFSFAQITSSYDYHWALNCKRRGKEAGYRSGVQSLATCCTVRISKPDRAKIYTYIFFFPKPFIRYPGPTQPPVKHVMPFLWANQAIGAWIRPSSADFKNKWRYTSTPPYAFVVRTRTTLLLPLKHVNGSGRGLILGISASTFRYWHKQKKTRIIHSLFRILVLLGHCI